MIFLALRNWRASPRAKNEADILGFYAGLVVHPLSPKTWTMSTLAYTQFAPNFTTEFAKLALIPLSFLLAQFFFHSIWCYAGVLLKSRFANNTLLTRALIILTIMVVLVALFY